MYAKTGRAFIAIKEGYGYGNDDRICTDETSIASSVKGKDDAGLRDQLMGLMGIY